MTEFIYEGNQVIPQFTTYQDNGRLALMLIDAESGEMYSVVTVNLSDENITNERCAFLDTNNNGDTITDWLEKHGFGKWTGGFGFSGFCIYPEFVFNQDVIDQYKLQPVPELFEEV